MKIAVVLALLTVFGISLCNAQTKPPSSTSSVLARFIRLRIIITRTRNGKTTRQEFNITVSNFLDLVKKLQEVVKNLPNSPTKTALENIINQLTTLLPKFITNSDDPTLASEIGQNVLNLITILSGATDPNLQKVFDELQNSITDLPPPPTTMKPTTMAPTTMPASMGSTAGNASMTTMATTMGPTTNMTVPPKVDPDTYINVAISVSDNSGASPNVSVEYPAQAQYVVTLLDLLIQSTNDTMVKEIATKLQELLKTFFDDQTYQNLFNVLLEAIQLLRNSNGDPVATSAGKAVISLVLNLLGGADIKGLDFKSIPILLSYLGELADAGSLTEPESDENLALLNNGNETDPLNLLKVLLAILKKLLPGIPDELMPPLESFNTALEDYIADPSKGSEDLLKALDDLVNAILDYDGPDRDSMIKLAMDIIQVLLDALPDDAAMLNELLKKLMDAQPNTTDPSSDGGCPSDLLNGLLCSVGNVVNGLLGTGSSSSGGSGGGNIISSLLGAISGILG